MPDGKETERMGEMVVIKVLREDWADAEIALPSYQTAGAAGADLCANLRPEDRASGVTLAPMGRIICPTGLRVEIPEGYEMQVRPRSGLATKFGISMPNTPGTVDSDYRGPLGVPLINLSDAPYVIHHGDRIAQAVIAPVLQARYELSEALGETERGTGGFGSTGKQ